MPPFKFDRATSFLQILDDGGDFFAQTYRSCGLATVRYPVLEITATVEPFENGKGFSLRVLQAGKPRTVTRTYALGNTGGK